MKKEKKSEGEKKENIFKKLFKALHRLYARLKKKLEPYSTPHCGFWKWVLLSLIAGLASGICFGDPFMGFLFGATVLFVAEFVLFIIFVNRNSYKSRKRNNGSAREVLTPLHWFTIATFISVFALLIPVCYATGCQNLGDGNYYVRPVLVALQTAFRVFILDGDLEPVTKGIKSLCGWKHFTYSFVASILYVAAPVLTFSNVLSLFKNVRNELKYRFVCPRRRIFVFSELNERSIFLARSIALDNSFKRPMLVFTDVFEQNEENDFELLEAARELRGVLLKKDIIRLKKNKSNCIEFFLIGDDESENLEQAVKLTEEYRDSCEKRTVKVFVYAKKKAAGYVLDSLNQGDQTIDCVLLKDIQDEVEAFNRKMSGDVSEGADASGARYPKFHLDTNENGEFRNCFYLRRIDSDTELAKSILIAPFQTGENNSESASDGKSPVPDFVQRVIQDKRISVLILGIGAHGQAVLKTALWLYQIKGLPLEITVIDKEDADTIKKKLQKDCPEILFDRRVNTKGSENYFVRIVGSTDFESSELRNYLLNRSNRSFLKKVQLAVVASGDDDKNIGLSVEVRRLFDQIRGVEYNSKELNKKVDEMPFIYSVVYDHRKASNLSLSYAAGNGGKTPAGSYGIVDHKGTSYHIRFVGSIREQFSYKRIRDLEKEEILAINLHLDWITEGEKLRYYYTSDEVKNHPAVSAFRDTVAAGGGSFKAPEPLKYDDVKSEVEKYTKYEYYRESSKATGFHKKIVSRFDEIFKKYETKENPHYQNLPVCSCPSCEAKRITEHMRWNAFMRTNGFCYGDNRSDRARIHPNLVSWYSLNVLERYKD